MFRRPIHSRIPPKIKRQIPGPVKRKSANKKKYAPSPFVRMKSCAAPASGNRKAQTPPAISSLLPKRLLAKEGRAMVRSRRAQHSKMPMLTIEGPNHMTSSNRCPPNRPSGATNKLYVSATPNAPATKATARTKNEITFLVPVFIFVCSVTPNDPSSATAATRRADGDCDGLPPCAAAQG